MDDGREEAVPSPQHPGNETISGENGHRITKIVAVAADHFMVEVVIGGKPYFGVLAPPQGVSIRDGAVSTTAPGSRHRHHHRHRNSSSPRPNYATYDILEYSGGLNGSSHDARQPVRQSKRQRARMKKERAKKLAEEIERKRSSTSQQSTKVATSSENHGDTGARGKAKSKKRGKNQQRGGQNENEDEDEDEDASSADFVKPSAKRQSGAPSKGQQRPEVERKKKLRKKKGASSSKPLPDWPQKKSKLTSYEARAMYYRRLKETAELRRQIRNSARLENEEDAGSDAEYTQKKTTSTEYEVQRIVDCRDTKAGFKFRIRWSGFGESDDTWEPEAHVPYAMIKNFFAEKEEQFRRLRQEERDREKRLKSEITPLVGLISTDVQQTQIQVENISNVFSATRKGAGTKATSEESQPEHSHDRSPSPPSTFFQSAGCRSTKNSKRSSHVPIDIDAVENAARTTKEPVDTIIKKAQQSKKRGNKGAAQQPVKARRHSSSASQASSQPKEEGSLRSSIVPTKNVFSTFKSRMRSKRPSRATSPSPSSLFSHGKRRNSVSSDSSRSTSVSVAGRSRKQSSNSTNGLRTPLARAMAGSGTSEAKKELPQPHGSSTNVDDLDPLVVYDREQPRKRPHLNSSATTTDRTNSKSASPAARGSTLSSTATAPEARRFAWQADHAKEKQRQDGIAASVRHACEALGLSPTKPRPPLVAATNDARIPQPVKEGEGESSSARVEPEREEAAIVPPQQSSAKSDDSHGSRPHSPDRAQLSPDPDLSAISGHHHVMQAYGGLERDSDPLAIDDDDGDVAGRADDAERLSI